MAWPRKALDTDILQYNMGVRLEMPDENAFTTGFEDIFFARRIRKIFLGLPYFPKIQNSLQGNQV